MPDDLRLKVLFIASEADPLIKVGGLGDVAGSLPRAFREIKQRPEEAPIKVDIRLAIPFHPGIHIDQLSPLLVAEYPIHTLQGDITAKAFSLEIDGLPIYLIAGAPIDKETAVYSADLEADGYKYVFFSMATLALIKVLNWLPDILHANDWHTAPAVYSLALQHPTDPTFNHTASLLTIHNLPYLGSMTSTALGEFGLPAAEHSDLPAWAQHMALPLGLLAADSIVAVSPGYAKEILTEQLGSGLHLFLKAHQEKISGILNGLDVTRWNPARDDEISVNFTAESLPARSANKTFLQEGMGLKINPDIPLLAMVTRLDPQKGVDLAISALRFLLGSSDAGAHRFQAILLGTGNPVLESAVRQLEKDYPEQIRARILYSEKLSRQIYAGADALLMPSRYEPCGLSQMIAMHYGCVPIARSTGGLSDTIYDTGTGDTGTGFLFKEPEPTEFVNAILRALSVYTRDPQRWQKMQMNGMKQDFSWDRSARAYLEQYRFLVDRKSMYNVSTSERRSV